MKIHELIADPSRWTQFGAGIRVIDGEDCAWCLFQAIKVCYPKDQIKIDSRIRDEIRKRDNLPADRSCSIVSWNDTHSHAEVLALCKELDI